MRRKKEEELSTEKSNDRVRFQLEITLEQNEYIENLMKLAHVNTKKEFVLKAIKCYANLMKFQNADGAVCIMHNQKEKYLLL